MITPGCLPLTTPNDLDEDTLKDDKKYKKQTPIYGLTKGADDYWGRSTGAVDDIDFDGTKDRQTGTSEELFLEFQLLRISMGFQILRSFDDKTRDKNPNKSSTLQTVAMILAPYVTVISLKSSVPPVECTTYTKQHTIGSKSEGSKAYYFAFCGKYNQSYQTKGFEFLSRFRGRGFLNFTWTDNKTKDINIRSIIEDSGEDLGSKWSWSHYSFRCRYVFIPEIRGTEVTADSIKNEEYCQQVKNEFIKLITSIVNEMSPVETRQAKTSANNGRDRTKTMMKAETRRERDNTDAKRHTSLTLQSMPSQPVYPQEEKYDPIIIDDSTNEQLDQLITVITKQVPSHYASPILASLSDSYLSTSPILTVFLACDIVSFLVEKQISRTVNDARRLLCHLVSLRKLQSLRYNENDYNDSVNHTVDFGIFYYFIPETRPDQDGDDADFDEDNLDDDDNIEYEQYQMMEVKMPSESIFTWRDEIRRTDKCPLKTVKRIIPKVKKNQ